jgi:HEAT repeat protein
VLDRFKRRELSEADAADIRHILFTDEEAGAKVMTRELAGWDLATGRAEGRLAGVLDGTVHLIGLRATAVYLPALEQFSRHPRTSLRVQVAVAYEQIGDPEGLAAVKRALKKEKEDEVRAEWVRALGACGRGEASVARSLIRLAEREKDDRVRLSAIFALGHVLPEDGAREFLGQLVAQGAEEDRRAALLALALGRAVDARPIVAELAQGDGDGNTREVAASALAVLDGGNLIGMREAVIDVVRSDTDRWRVFFWRGG